MLTKMFPAIIICSLLISCGSKEEDTFEVKLKELAEKNVAKVISIDTLISSQWDEFAIFGSYFPKDEACQILDLSAWSCFWLPYPKPQDHSPHLVVFINKKAIVETSFINICTVRILGNESNKVRQNRRDGKFLVHQKTGECINPPYILIQQ